jgi:GNAT superfamily N-acetyltransferase
MIDIASAGSGEALDAARKLMRAFVAWHRERHLQDLKLIDDYFDARAFEDELASLPGKYSPPAGRLFVACRDGDYAGCVALRPIDAQACEMKRMFVYPRFHGRGVGRALSEIVIQQARDIGYRSMLLDTSVRQVEAQSLYRSLGFEPVEPYYEVPAALRNWLVFMHLAL